jgi:hypothetical protein
VPNGIKRKRTQATPDRKSHGTRMDQVRKNYEKKKIDTIYGKKVNITHWDILIQNPISDSDHDSVEECFGVESEFFKFEIS